MPLAPSILSVKHLLAQLNVMNSEMPSKVEDLPLTSLLTAFADLQWIVKLSTEESYETNSQFFLDKKIEALVSLIFTLLLLVK